MWDNGVPRVHVVPTNRYFIVYTAAVQLYRCKFGFWRTRFLARFRICTVPRYGDFKKLLVDALFLAPDPCFPSWGCHPLSALCTVSRADMVWKDVMLAVLPWQVQLPPARRPRAGAAAPRASQTTAPFPECGAKSMTFGNCARKNSTQ